MIIQCQYTLAQIPSQTLHLNKRCVTTLFSVIVTETNIFLNDSLLEVQQPKGLSGVEQLHVLTLWKSMDYSFTLKMLSFMLVIGIYRMMEFKETDFVDLIKVCRESWMDANIYISLITERKDLPNGCVLQVNQTIRLACEKAQNLGIHVSIIEQVKPREDMFHDDIHLNNKGVAAIVKHIKLAVGLSGNRDAKLVNVQRPDKQKESVNYNVSQSDPACVHHPFASGSFVNPPFLPNMQWQNPFTCMWPPYPMWPPTPPHQINGDRYT